MRKLTLIAAIIGTAGALAVTVPAPASARETLRFSFDVGGVTLAFRDGYYDHHHHWHKWRSRNEMRSFRARYSRRFRDYDHDGVRNAYDYDRDGDGIPNRFDAQPNRPNRDIRGYGTRRDRDHDGVPNRFDARPNNPWRY